MLGCAPSQLGFYFKDTDTSTLMLHPIPANLMLDLPARLSQRAVHGGGDSSTVNASFNKVGI